MLFRLLFVFLFVTASAGAQPAITADSIYTVTDSMPEFPGGNAELKKYLREHTRYPVSGVERRIEGAVYIRFVVEKDGTLSNFVVMKQITNAPDFTTEALRVTKSMSHWMPGRMGNKPVRCYVFIPVRFVAPPPPVADSLHASGAAALVHPEVPASFPGGDGEMRKYLEKNLIYPREYVEAGIEGKVFLSFMVETDGRITDIKVLKEINGAPGLTKEAIRLVQNMPRWTPGSYNGTVVRMKYNIPVKFTLK